jgi:uncharacterized protein YcbK (DUF882 family)
MKLTKHFTFEELTASELADRHGIDNTPASPLILTNLKILAEGLERVRALLGKPVIVNSGYRSILVNNLLGKQTDKSTHERIGGRYYLSILWNT